MTEIWQPPPVKYILWSQNKPAVEAAVLAAGMRVCFMDGWAMICRSSGPGGKKPSVAFCNEGQYILLDTGEVSAKRPGT